MSNKQLHQWWSNQKRRRGATTRRRDTVWIQWRHMRCVKVPFNFMLILHVCSYKQPIVVIVQDVISFGFVKQWMSCWAGKNIFFFKIVSLCSWYYWNPYLSDRTFLTHSSFFSFFFKFSSVHKRIIIILSDRKRLFFIYI